MRLKSIINIKLKNRSLSIIQQGNHEEQFNVIENLHTHMQQQAKNND